MIFFLLNFFYVGGDLHDFLKSVEMTDDLMKSGTLDLLSGLNYLHYKNVIHSDLKPKNIFVIRTNQNAVKLKIGDIDDPVHLMRSVTGSADVKKFYGTYSYASPEMFTFLISKTAPKTGRKTDIWSLGCVLLDMANSGKPRKMKTKGLWGKFLVLNDDVSDEKIIKFMESGGRPFINSEISTSLQDLLNICFQEKPDDRQSCAMLLKHSYLTKEQTVSIVPFQPSFQAHRKVPVESPIHAELRSCVEVCSFRLLAGTWNVNGKRPEECVGLFKWLDNADAQPDFYILGFQGFSQSGCKSVWRNYVETEFKAKDTHVLVGLVDPAGVELLLFIYVSREHSQDIKNISESDHWFGCGLRLDMHGRGFCFMTSSAVREVPPLWRAITGLGLSRNIEKQNGDFEKLFQQTKFDWHFREHIDEHDIIIWVGHFQYDVDEYLTLVATQSSASNDQVQKLATIRDQLMIEMERGNVFRRFEEGLITFPPSEGNIIALLGWYDRVLWRCNQVQDTAVSCTLYASWPHREFGSVDSEPKPVAALLQIDMTVINKERTREVYHNMWKNINSSRPEANVLPYEVNVGDVTVWEEVKKILVISNTGTDLPVHFEFVNQPGSDRCCKEWLTVMCPDQTSVAPGEVLLVTLVIQVEKKCVAKLTSGEEKLEDILILHVKDGTDLFVKVKGNYIPSSFGMSLTELETREKPIRPKRSWVTGDNESVLLGNPDRAVDIPVEVLMLLNSLHRFSKMSGFFPDLFVENCEIEEVRVVRDYLDYRRGPEPEFASLKAMGGALKLYFDMLPESVVPGELYGECLASVHNYERAAVLEKFPRVHRATFRAIVVLLRSYREGCKKMKMTYHRKNLEIIADSILRQPAHGDCLTETEAQSQAKLRTDFLEHFLDNPSPDEPALEKLNCTLL